MKLIYFIKKSDKLIERKHYLNIKNVCILLIAKFLTFDFVSLVPLSSDTSIPPSISFCLINGMLTQFAAATAANGTYLFEILKEINKNPQLNEHEIFFTYSHKWICPFLPESFTSNCRNHSC